MKQSVPGIVRDLYKLVSCGKFLNNILFSTIYKTHYLTFGHHALAVILCLCLNFFWVINNLIVLTQPKKPKKIRGSIYFSFKVMIPGTPGINFCTLWQSRLHFYFLTIAENTKILRSESIWHQSCTGRKLASKSYSEFQGFRSLLASQLFSSQFWPLLTRASFFEAAKAVAKIGLSLKSNHHCQI